MTDVTGLSRALARAFADDPVWSWLVPGDRRVARLQRFFALEMQALAIPQGTVTAAPGGVGAALCFPPDRWRMPPLLLARHSPAYARVFGHRLGHAAVLLGRMEAQHLREPHHYVAYVGVAPEGQGQGHGTRLLEPTLARADADGLPAYLEASSPVNVRLYERLGFVATSEVSVFGSPPLKLMRRPPAPGAAARSGSR